MNKYIGIDLGTSSVKMLLVGSNGEILKSVSKDYPIFYPQSGWSEQNPIDWYNATISGLSSLLEDCEKESVKGISFGGQMHGLVALDKNDNVLRPAILWNDGRTEKQTAYLNEVIGKEKLSKYTANIAFAGFTAPKILWMKENEPELFAKIEKIMLPKDYLAYRLSGVFATDFSDASGMLLLDVKNRRWSEKMCEICSISAEKLPSLYESYEVIGTLLPDIASALGLSSDVKICIGAGDNAAAAIGTGTVQNGSTNISLGTSGTVFVSQDSFSIDKNNSLHSFCHANGKYHLMGCILSAASCNKWWLENVLGTGDFSSEQEGLDSMLGKNDVFFMPYLMGERSPHNDVSARGAFIGMRPDDTRKSLTLAVYEGVAFALRDCVEIARASGIKIERASICGGGAKSELWRKIIANVLSVPVSRPAIEEGPSYGAAILAMVGCGEYSSVFEATEVLVKVQDTAMPNDTLVELYNKKYEIFKRLYPCLREVYKCY